MDYAIGTMRLLKQIEGANAQKNKENQLLASRLSAEVTESSPAIHSVSIRDVVLQLGNCIVSHTYFA